MNSQFLEGLITARNLLAYGGGLARLDELIAENESDSMESASLISTMEKR